MPPLKKSQSSSSKKKPSNHLSNETQETLFTQEIAFAYYEEIRLKAMEKGLYNIARAVVKNQCELFSLDKSSTSSDTAENLLFSSLENEFQKAFPPKENILPSKNTLSPKSTLTPTPPSKK